MNCRCNILKIIHFTFVNIKNYLNVEIVRNFDTSNKKNDKIYLKTTLNNSSQ